MFCVLMLYVYKFSIILTLNALLYLLISFNTVCFVRFILMFLVLRFLIVYPVMFQSI